MPPSESEASDHDITDYESLRAADLKEELRKRGLKTSGTKDALIERLRDRVKSTGQQTAHGAATDERNGAAKRSRSEAARPSKRRKSNGTTDGKVQAVLLDIEGTTTSISFVHNELFPYAKAQLDEFVDEHWEREDCQDCLRLAETENGELQAADAEKKKATFVATMRAAMEADKKITSLKKLQGLMWKSGYESGELKGHVFADVPGAFERWSAHKKLYIYSSGSIAAQKLLFGQSVAGDLMPHLSGYFDTTTGPKIESTSYEKIAHSVSLPPASILFLTDIAKEADAAKAAGLQTALCDRPGNGELSEAAKAAHPVLKTFEEVDALL